MQDSYTFCKHIIATKTWVTQNTLRFPLLLRPWTPYGINAFPFFSLFFLHFFSVLDKDLYAPVNFASAEFFIFSVVFWVDFRLGGPRHIVPVVFFTMFYALGPRTPSFNQRRFFLVFCSSFSSAPSKFLPVPRYKYTLWCFHKNRLFRHFRCFLLCACISSAKLITF